MDERALGTGASGDIENPALTHQQVEAAKPAPKPAVAPPTPVVDKKD